MKSVDAADHFERILRRGLPRYADVAIRELAFAAPYRRWRADFAWPLQRVMVEIDGGMYAALGGRHNSDPDKEKANAAAALGWSVLHFSVKMTEDHAGYCLLVLQAALEGTASAKHLPVLPKPIRKRRPRTRMNVK